MFEHEAAASTSRKTPGWALLCLLVICAAHAAISCIGITWGLPTRRIDNLLFGDGEVWSGERIYKLARADGKLSESRIHSTGADVDMNSLHARKNSGGPLLLTGSDQSAAEIYLRYRLYTYQPDEMITMMALAGMKPAALQLDPRLYQYGGLFIYPVGALIGVCGLAGLIDVRSDVAWYLDHPDEFGKFYVVARAYSAVWGMVGILITFAVTRRLAREAWPAAQSLQIRLGLLASLLFALMPVVVCMSHEGKPHLPGAVLMLLAVYFAMRSLSFATESMRNRRAALWLMSATCGAAVGMVLSSWPICILIPLTVVFNRNVPESFANDTTSQPKILKAGFFVPTILGTALALAIYFATNPYVLINAISNRQVLRSNFGNSLAMYEISRFAEGFVRVIELTVEGATAPVVILGFIALGAGLIGRMRKSPGFWILVIPAALFLLQFILLGAGKPAEFGRFGIFANTALAIGCSSLFGCRRLSGLAGTLLLCLVLLWQLGNAGKYSRGFHLDSQVSTSRIRAAHQLEELSAETPIVVPAEPAPYSCPPMNFAKTRILLADEEQLPAIKERFVLVYVDDRSQQAGISWASKRIQIRSSPPMTWRPPIEYDHD